MIAEMASLVLMFSLGSLALVFLMFLPTLVELRRPADAGPRLIFPVHSMVLSQKSIIMSVVNVEEHDELDFLLVPLVAKVVWVLPNLEA